MKLIDLTGQRFGRLLVIKKCGRKGRSVAWLCRCDCGSEKIMKGCALLRGVQSCGCLRKDKLLERISRHGLCGQRIYGIWAGMLQRCSNQKQRNYSRYGGRGITVCDEWRQDFEAFYNWAMAHGYKDGLTIDRIDNDKGYYPDNCRWITMKNQANNRHNNHYLEFNGHRHTISEWSELLGINKHTIRCRLKRGWSIERTLTEEIKK